MKEARNGKPYDVDHTYKERMSLGMRLLIAGIAGLIVAASVVIALLGQLKSVGVKRGAMSYVREGSFQVTRQRDLFLYRTVTRIKKEKPQSGGGGGSSTHTTSGGGRAGGHTGSF